MARLSVVVTNQTQTTAACGDLVLEEEGATDGSLSNSSPRLLSVPDPSFTAGSDDQAAREPATVLTPRRRAKMGSINEDDAHLDKLLMDDSTHVHPHERRADCYRLCSFDEAPPYLQHNPFIRTGYRVNFSISLCIRSLYRLHNESWNIWTHLGGFLLFLGLGCQLMQLEWRTAAEPFLFLLFVLTVECSMLSSTIFHAFNCHSPGTYKWTCRFDYSSISLLLVGAYSPMLYYAFMCQPLWQALYLSGLSLLGLAGVIISFVPFFSTPQYTIYRTGVFVALGWSTILPLPHMLYIHGVRMVWQLARWELLVGLIYTTGAVIYAKRIPERWNPGKYDLSFLCSHSLWHCFTIAGALTQLYACMCVYEAYPNLSVCE